MRKESGKDGKRDVTRNNAKKPTLPTLPTLPGAAMSRVPPREFGRAGGAVAKVRGKGGVSVPPFPWSTEVELDGRIVRLARPRIEAVDMVEAVERNPNATSVDDELVIRRARVWRTTLPPMLRSLPPSGKAAMLDFAEAVERAGASRGAGSPLNGGGTSAGPRSPSIAHLAAAERFRHMRAALAAAPAAEIIALRGERDRFVSGRWRVPLFDLAFAAAVEGLSRRALAARIAGSARAGTLESVTVGVSTAAARLAECCGY
jgi:hypothetical protein